MTSALTQSNFSNSGFDISWTTDNTGSSNIAYGLSQFRNRHINNSASTTHIV